MNLRLDRNLVTLRHARGARIRVTAGRVWITEDGSPSDHFVAAGGDYRVAGDGLVVVENFRYGAGAPEACIAVRMQ